ncbi:unnamed protein product [Arabidopsis halleri]
MLMCLTENDLSTESGDSIYRKKIMLMKCWTDGEVAVLEEGSLLSRLYIDLKFGVCFTWIKGCSRYNSRGT